MTISHPTISLLTMTLSLSTSRTVSPLLLFVSFLFVCTLAQDNQNDDESNSKLFNTCRNHPTWRNLPVNNVNCSQALGYNPEQFDVLEGVADSTPYYNVPDSEKPAWIQTMYQCMQEKAKAHTNLANDEVVEDGATVTNLFPSPSNAVLGTVEYVLNEQERATLVDLKDCIQEHHPGQLEHRSFAYGEMDEEEAKARGGNDATFLAGYLQLFAPGVAARVYNAGHLVWKAAKWGDQTEVDEDGKTYHPYPNPYECGIRTTEHLNYQGWSGLGAHEDSESLYTVLVAFRDRAAYGGGEFYIEPSVWWNGKYGSMGGKIAVKPNKLSAIVFLSEERHGVLRIENGTREMFTTEIWAYGDVPVDHRRPRIEDYLEFKEAQEGGGESSDEGEGAANDEL